MKRIEPNLLLAITTCIALLLLILTASVFGQPGGALKYGIIVLAVVVAFIPLNALLARKMGWARPPMIHAGAASTAAWASLFPMMVIMSAAIPVFWPGHDYGLLVIIASLWFGLTVESALKARQAG